MPNSPSEPPMGEEEPRELSDQQMTCCPNDIPIPLKDKDDSMNVFKSDGVVITSAATSKREARRNVGERLKMRKSTPRPTMKGNGKKRFNASPSPSSKPELKRALADDGDGEEGYTNGLKKNLMEELDAAAAGFESNSSNNLDVEGSLPTGSLKCNRSASPTDVSQTPRQESGHAFDQGVNCETHKGRQDAQAGPFTKDTFENALVNLPDKEMGTQSSFASALLLFQKGGPCVSTIFETSTIAKLDEIFHLASLDSAETLDNMAAQPLLASDPPVNENANTNLLTHSMPSLEPSHAQHMATPLLSYEEFPPIEKGRTLKIRNKFEIGKVHPSTPQSGSRLKWGNTSDPSPAGENIPGKDASNLFVAEIINGNPRATNMPEVVSAPIREGNSKDPINTSHQGGAEAASRSSAPPKSMADMLKANPDPNGPQPFEPEKIQNIGFATSSNGIPAIYFSGAENQKLAESMGHAIVGKFSHSIPTGHQIQKALNNIKLQCGYSWKYINAKHILIQCEDLVDYARLLGGPKGTPVWYVDRHPMRVFKWTSDFDVYCESPIAAIWCNLIGLPIHLFDHSALFAIGKLLGTPIQVDRATANKSRLSFARICIEIDITKPPPEEIVLDICGRETVQKVRWDKIPAYCRECRHVGHFSDVCYATGKRERPPKRDYNPSNPKQPQAEAHTSKDSQELVQQNPNPNEWKQQWKKKGKDVRSNGVVAEDVAWEGPVFMGELKETPGPTCGVQAARGPGAGGGTWGSPSHPSHFSPLRIQGQSGGDPDVSKNQRPISPRTRGGSRGGGRHSSSRGRGYFPIRNHMSSNKYYSLMENGDFDVDECEEVEELIMEMPPGSNKDDAMQQDGVDKACPTNEEQQPIGRLGGNPNLPGKNQSV